MLTGGTAAQAGNQSETGTNFGSVTRPNVKTIYASAKKQYDVRILPAFDMSMSIDDEAFGEGWEPYRTREGDPDPDTDTEGFTAWFWPIKVYTYFGLGKKQFISPLTMADYYPAGYDPVRDAYVYINEYVNDPNIKALALGKNYVDSTTGKPKILPGYLSKTPRQMALMNVLIEGSTRGSWENAVLVVTRSALIDLKKQLSRQTKRSDDIVVSPDWEDYYYGDITHPTEGCIARVQEKKISMGGGSANTTAGFFLEQDPDNEAKHHLNQFPVSKEQLKGRWRVFDTENVTNLPEKTEQYQTILDFLVEDGVVPLSVLEAACGKYGKVKKELRMSNFSWFEGEDPIPDDPNSTTVSKSTKSPPKSSVGTQKAETTAPAVGSLKKGETKQESKEESESGEEEVKEETQTEPEPEKEESPNESSDDDSPEKKRYDALVAKLTDGTALTPDELTEIGELTKSVG